MGAHFPFVLALTLALSSHGCAHYKTPDERLQAARSLQAIGDYEQALKDLVVLLQETPPHDTVMRSVLHLRVAESLLHLQRTKQAAAEVRRGLALDSRTEASDWWSKTLVLLDENKTAQAENALRKAVGANRIDVGDFARAAWLAPLRALAGYRTIVASVLLNAGRVEEEDLHWLNASGGINIQPLNVLIAAPDRAAGACSLAVIQLREPFPSAQPMTRVVGELVLPRVEGTGVEFQRETRTTTVETSFSSSTTGTYRSGRGVYWGSSLLATSGVSSSTIRSEENVPTTSYSVVLNPQELFAVFQYSGLDQALLQNRVAVVFACLREVAPLLRGVLQQQRAPILEVVAYSPFEAGGLPIRRTAGDPVLSQ